MPLVMVLYSHNDSIMISYLWQSEGPGFSRRNKSEVVLFPLSYCPETCTYRVYALDSRHAAFCFWPPYTQKVRRLLSVAGGLLLELIFPWNTSIELSRGLSLSWLHIKSDRQPRFTSQENQLKTKTNTKVKAKHYKTHKETKSHQPLISRDFWDAVQTIKSNQWLPLQRTHIGQFTANCNSSSRWWTFFWPPRTSTDLYKIYIQTHILTHDKINLK